MVAVAVVVVVVEVAVVELVACETAVVQAGRGAIGRNWPDWPPALLGDR